MAFASVTRINPGYNPEKGPKLTVAPETGVEAANDKPYDQDANRPYDWAVDEAPAPASSASERHDDSESFRDMVDQDGNSAETLLGSVAVGSLAALDRAIANAAHRQANRRAEFLEKNPHLNPAWRDVGPPDLHTPVLDATRPK